MKITDKDLVVSFDSGFSFTVEAKFGNQKWAFNQHRKDEPVVCCHFNESDNRNAVWLKCGLSGVDKTGEVPALNASNFTIDKMYNFPPEFTEATFGGLALRCLINKMKKPGEGVHIRPLSTDYLYMLFLDECKPDPDEIFPIDTN